MKRSDIDHTKLLLFNALMETRSLSDAANRLGLTVPTASRVLGQMRDTFDDELFTRFGRGLVPTKFAIALKPRVDRLLEGFSLLHQTTPFKPDADERTFRIACVDNAAYAFLQRAILDIMQKAPSMHFELASLGSDILAELRSGTVDFAIFPFESVPEHFQMTPLYAVPQKLVTGTNHPLVKRYESLGHLPDAEEISSYKRIDIFVHPLQHWRMHRNEANAGEQDVAFVTPFFLAAALTLNECDFTMRLPASTANRLEKLGILRAFDFPKPQRANTPKLVWHERLDGDAASEWVRACIVASAAQESESTKP